MKSYKEFMNEGKVALTFSNGNVEQKITVQIDKKYGKDVKTKALGSSEVQYTAKSSIIKGIKDLVKDENSIFVR